MPTGGRGLWAVALTLSLNRVRVRVRVLQATVNKMVQVHSASVKIFEVCDWTAQTALTVLDQLIPLVHEGNRGMSLDQPLHRPLTPVKQTLCYISLWWVKSWGRQLFEDFFFCAVQFCFSTTECLKCHFANILVLYAVALLNASGHF